ncbi:flagellar motor stator protein MotA [Rhodovibrio salinarum]|nr:flagellar motor stator protein MotA [Rhodovibrio salinarum]
MGIVVMGVFGGYLLAGGKMSVIIKALPFEFMMIGGAALGALLIANSMKVVKQTFGGVLRVIKGPKWKQKDYQDLLCLLYALANVYKKKGALGLEQHVEQPSESQIFQTYPKVLNDHFACAMICDTLRMMTLNLEDPHQIDDYIDRLLEKHHHEDMQGAQALQTTADALPALGIVAAVLGVIKTMASINEPPEVLGKLIGGALVGTFLGVFLAYGFVGPLSSRLSQIVEDDSRFYHVIKDVLVAIAQGAGPQLAVEIGRGNVPTAVQPSFFDLEQAVEQAPAVT